MVRTAVTGIRVSAGKSSKKVGGGASTPSTSSQSVSSKSAGSSSKLPPIPFQETPSWQKPITTFFKSNSPLKSSEKKKQENRVEKPHEQLEDEAGPSKKKLKFNNEDTIESEQLEETTAKNGETILEGNKENESKNTTESDETTSTSKE